MSRMINVALYSGLFSSCICMGLVVVALSFAPSEAVAAGQGCCNSTSGCNPEPCVRGPIAPCNVCS